MANVKVIENKQQVVDTLKEKVNSAKVFILSDFRSISVKEITELRKKLHSEDSEYKIVKNTLLRKALEAAGFNELNQHLEGPTGLLLGYKDPVGPLKTLVQFMEELEKGEIKAGAVEKTILDRSGIVRMAKLPPKEILLAKIVGGLKSPLYGLVNVLQGNIRKLVYALNAVREKKQ